MNLLTKLLNRKPETSANLAAEIDARKVALSEAHARVSAAAAARANALDDLDEGGMARADAEAADAARTVELGSKALEILTAAHAKAVEAEKAEARAAVKAALVKRRDALGEKFAVDWMRAAAVLAEVVSEARTLQRDVSEGGLDREVERLPEIGRFDRCAVAVSTLSLWLGDALSGLPVVPESPKERDSREYKEARARREVERKAASDRQYEEGRERLRASREAEDAKARERERHPFYPTLQDSAR